MGELFRRVNAWGWAAQSEWSAQVLWLAQVQWRRALASWLVQEPPEQARQAMAAAPTDPAAKQEPGL